jgi:hypothetical protein
VGAKQTVKIMMIAVLTVLYMLLVTSCGVRKVEKHVEKETTNIESSTINQNDISVDIESKIVINEETDEVEIKPIDTSKVIMVNGKAYKNAIVTVRKKKINTVTDIKEVTKDNSIKKTNTVTTVDKTINSKHTKKKNSLRWYLLLFLIPVILFLIYMYKNKVKITSNE